MAKKKIKGLYKLNKEAKTGETIECPICHTKFIKRQYSQAFCSTQCKDKFHNNRNKDRHNYESLCDDYDECFNVSEVLDIYS